jgi:ElaB/YqjD/DUF883 family membrane-anchored ribosome-binding protein
MARNDGRSLAELQHEAERTRAELASTVEQVRSKMSDTVTDLRARVSPEAVKADISDYFSAKVDALMDKARENPLQTAAIGIGIGYPLFRIARSVPAPVMMVGAGLYLLGSSSAQKVTGNITSKLGEVAGHASDQLSLGLYGATQKARDARDTAADGLASARDMLASGLGSASQKASAVSATVTRGAGDLPASAANLAASVSDALADLKQQAASAVGATTDNLLGGAATASSMVRETADNAAGFGTGAAMRLRNQAEMSQNMVSAVSDTIRQNPFLVGGLGLVLGMLVASALPKSGVEESLVGNAPARIGKRASELAATGVDAAKNMVSASIGDLVDDASHENLTPAELNAAAEDFGQRVRKVAESATDAAFGESDEKTTDAA